MLDQSNTGIITAENLYAELSRVDSEITYEEVEDVLKKVDKDGNGEIDFDEFLVHMTNLGGNLYGDEVGEEDEEQRKKKSRRKEMFYKTITCFSIKHTLADIEKQFRKQAPHVIGHYTAGARLIGLTTRQLERQMERMQRSIANTDSPYAKPLQFVHVSRKGTKSIVQRKKTKTIKEMPGSCRDLQQKESVGEEQDNLTREIQDTMITFAHESLESDKNSDIFMQLRKKLGSVKAKFKEQKQQTPEDSHISTFPSLNKPSYDKKSPTGLQPSGTKQKEGIYATASEDERKMQKKKKKNLMLALGWTTPRIQYIDVALPSLKMQLSQKPTCNDVHRIRAKAEQVLDDYYLELSQEEIQNAWNHWDRLYANVIQPERLLRSFKTIYSAYFPHREEEAFVVCPWIPGPFSFVRHFQKPSAIMSRKIPNKTITRSAMHKPRINIRPRTGSNTVYSSSSTPRDTPSPIGSPYTSISNV